MGDRLIERTLVPSLQVRVVTVRAASLPPACPAPFARLADCVICTAQHRLTLFPQAMAIVLLSKMHPHYVVLPCLSYFPAQNPRTARTTYFIVVKTSTLPNSGTDAKVVKFGDLKPGIVRFSAFHNH